MKTMTIYEAINGRRSVRNYQQRPVDRALIEKLITQATQAPSSMNSQPWAFVVISDREKLTHYSTQTKSMILGALDDYPVLARYQGLLSQPDFDIFHGAPALMVICAKPEGSQPREDCCMAAQNFMLAAQAEKLGTCWIGFARIYLNQPIIKTELHIPQEYEIAAPLIVGYPATVPPASIPRKEAEILNWI